MVRASTASRRCRARLYWAWFSGRISMSRPTSLLVWGRGSRGQRSSLGVGGRRASSSMAACVWLWLWSNE
ncbi:hypothetical protein EYF80_062873 [Liparis tanakae]|uniref:Uncharacterized protein n=1 Tax=Liparis tanakae TaxID=230148 RepID=A0A4Z2EER6_9TELE|nr:hypothetical protein EYF80_062873 [Liparis tanakae]